MAYFARKLRYCAGGDEAGMHYVALVEVARKKGGRPVLFVLYRRVVQFNYWREDKTEMCRLGARTADDAVTRFWPSDIEKTGKDFPGWRGQHWEKTTLWLDVVGEGGAYERCGYRDDESGAQYGRWTKVGTPAPWSRRRKRKVPRFGDISHRLPELRARIRELEDAARELRWEQKGLEAYDDENDSGYVPEENEEAYARAGKMIERINEEISAVSAAILATKAELRAQVRRMFPQPAGLTPRRVRRMFTTRATGSVVSP